MSYPLDDVRYYTGRISIAEAQAAGATCAAARHAHETLAALYRERLETLLQGLLESGVDEEGCA